jgi:hypothetical protein
MPRYRPYVDAIQWLGNNVTQVRQFINAAPGAIRSATVREGILYVAQVGSVIEIPVPQNNWLVRRASEVFTLDPADFDSQYLLDL